MYALSNLSITLAYFAIALILAVGVMEDRKRRLERLPLGRRERRFGMAVYAAFILSCGLGHIDGWLAFRWPAYHLFALWHLLTAVISWFAVYVTFRLRFRIVAGL